MKCNYCEEDSVIMVGFQYESSLEGVDSVVATMHVCTSGKCWIDDEFMSWMSQEDEDRLDLEIYIKSKNLKLSRETIVFYEQKLRERKIIK